MDLAREQDRMFRMLELDRAMQGLMVRAMPGVCARADVDEMIGIRGVYRELGASAVPSDTLVTADTLSQRIADVTEWIARALDSMNDQIDALSYYREARGLYAALKDTGAVTRIDDRIGDLRVQSGDGLDDELGRVRRRLEDEGLDALARVKALILLGELLTKGGDDFEAQQPLLEAEHLLEATPNMSRDEILACLAESMRLMFSGATSAGDAAPIVRAMELRALYQRLYFALGNAHRDTHPARAQEYERKLAAFDATGGGVDASVVARLMEQLRGLGG